MECWREPSAIAHAPHEQPGGPPNATVVSYVLWEAACRQELALEEASAYSTPLSAVCSAARAILARVQVEQEEIERLRNLSQTLPDRSHNPDWLIARRWRLTASRFHEIVEALDSGRAPTLADKVLCKQGWWHRRFDASRAYESEAKALSRYREWKAAGGEEVYVREVGTLVSRDTPWLAASPDGMVFGRDGMPMATVEIKGFNADARPGSRVWHQVQGSMALASASFGLTVHSCDLVTPKGISRVDFNASAWENTLQRLRSFYFDVFLPSAGQHVMFGGVVMPGLQFIDFEQADGRVGADSPAS